MMQLVSSMGILDRLFDHNHFFFPTFFSLSSLSPNCCCWWCDWPVLLIHASKVLKSAGILNYWVWHRCGEFSTLLLRASLHGESSWDNCRPAFSLALFNFGFLDAARLSHFCDCPARHRRACRINFLTWYELAPITAFWHFSPFSCTQSRPDSPPTPVQRSGCLSTVWYREFSSTIPARERGWEKSAESYLFCIWVEVVFYMCIRIYFFWFLPIKSEHKNGE